MILHINFLMPSLCLISLQNSLRPDNSFLILVWMAVVPVCYKMPYKDHFLPPQNSVRCISSDARKRWQLLFSATDILLRTNKRTYAFKASALHRVWSIEGENSSMASKTSAAEKQLSLLDSYFGQLHGNSNQPSSLSSDETPELLENSKQFNTIEELKSLNSYLEKLNKGYVSSNFEENSASVDDDDSERGAEETLKCFIRKKKMKDSTRRSQNLEENDETSHLYLISVLVSIDIAVFLFEVASPVRNSEFGLFSLPLLYGAKINDLILVGEWWRLITPMFLHSGVFHVGVGCWSLVTFGPQVCRGYGSFTFFLIYILGGISGNLTSFLHTSEPTVGGTGPLFGVIGAWLVYQMQNKDVIAKDVTDSMFQKAIVTTGLCFILSHFGPIDDWTHLGAVTAGIVYGFLTCPTLQLDNASSTSAQEEGIALVRQHANPCKSLALFAVCILFLSSLLFFVEPPLDALTLLPDDFVLFLKQDAML